MKRKSILSAIGTLLILTPSLVFAQGVENSVLFDSEKIKIESKELTSNFDETSLDIHMENRTPLNLGIMPYAYAVNGVMVGENKFGLNCCNVAAGKKARTKLSIDGDKIDEYKIGEIESADFIFWAYDNDKSMKSFDTGQIHAGSKKRHEISGTTVYNNGGIKLDYISKNYGKYTYCLTNTTGEYINFTAENITANDYTITDEYNFESSDIIVLNNCQSVFDVTVTPEQMEANGIEYIEKLEFSLCVKPSDRYEREYRTEMIATSREMITSPFCASGIEMQTSNESMYLIAKEILRHNLGTFLTFPPLSDEYSVEILRNANECEVIGTVDVRDDLGNVETLSYDVEFEYQRTGDESYDYKYNAFYVYIDGFIPYGNRRTIKD